ncbi:hypothetical protein THRCLA_03377 [Thraustotheca clavata]|uniref:EF-hand domain-containing protein n=1 Tax=Thraustotheca clavata TaxID=74557 RepID=A0A1W0A275_9STRA|nr:hypothetical protein THRCLA_03377 [Thraustotheca clavata]
MIHDKTEPKILSQSSPIASKTKLFKGKTASKYEMKQIVVKAKPSDVVPIDIASIIKEFPDIDPNDDLTSPVGIYGPQFTRRETEDVCYSLGMTQKEVNTLIGLFNDIDVNLSGLINLTEFYYLLESPQNEYTKGILRLAPERKDPKKIDIDDFIQIICKFSIMDREDIVAFCFETFDEDESGSLDTDEFLNLCNAIQVKGDTFFNGNFKRAMEFFDKNHDGLLDLSEFQEINTRYQLIFYPLFQFQNKLQSKTLGWWKWYQLKHRGLKISSWQTYMSTHLGRDPPLTMEDRFCSCMNRNTELRLIAKHFYHTNQARQFLKAKRAATVVVSTKESNPPAKPDDVYNRRKLPIQPPNPKPTNTISLPNRNSSQKR